MYKIISLKYSIVKLKNIGWTIDKTAEKAYPISLRKEK